MDCDDGARAALRLLGPDPQDWVAPRPGVDHNVMIVGGGQTGCAFAYAMRRAGIGRVSVIDAAADATQAGVWRTCARMVQLRTPKSLVGPEVGLPQLGFQAWFEARKGTDAYAALERIPRLAWAEYLDWYREFLGITVRRRTLLSRIEPADGHLRIHLTVDGTPQVETARKIILASGVLGGGGPYLPPAVAGLPEPFRAHTSEAIDLAALRGRTVSVVGGAASAVDAAGVALEAGAAAVHLFVRRAALANLPVSRVRGYPGAYDNYASLPDIVRWQQALRFKQAGSTPTADAIARAVAFPNFHLHLNAPWQAATIEDGRIVAQTGAGSFRSDFVIAGTGYAVDVRRRPELADIAADILLWSDRLGPEAAADDVDLAAHPYLGAGHEYLEKQPGRAPFLKDIHVFNTSGFVSFGVPVGDVPSMRRGIPAVTTRISRDLFLDDLPLHERRLTAEVGPDFGPNLYAAAVQRAAAA